ncbi:Hcp family type VI secretion system effector [Nitrincola iocasae]|uniref:Type VI secretion system tube protein Hcp n=1 Tax=Nitrincola iocasae TaxID=2614693 RepID=A0A5J6LBR3_9GAMM|nr:type VI secretion system tube protein Hcp [Nitrincola iocasae]QEW05718.1 type VI secretion system tube protein Hcp [Nitrincola iocasae]
MAIYLKIDGVEGDVTESTHTNWVECDSMSWNVSRALSTKPGQGKDRESTSPSIGEIALVTKMDKSSPVLFSEACVGQGKTALIHMVQTSPNGIETYMEYTLTNALVSEYSVSADRINRPLESIKLNFTKIEMRYTPWDESHRPEGSVPAGYDIALGIKL